MSTCVCNNHRTRVRLIILTGKNEIANKISIIVTIRFLNPTALKTHARLKKIFVVSQIKKCGTVRVYDPGTYKTPTPV